MTALAPLDCDDLLTWLTRAWRTATDAAEAPPDDDVAILALVEEAIQASAVELGIEVTVRHEDRQLRVVGKALPPRTVCLCNGRLQDGQLGRQLDGLRLAMRPGTLSVALRNAGWRLTPKSSAAIRVGNFEDAGGRTATIEEHHLREIAGARALIAADPPGLHAWRVRSQPHAQIGFIRELLDLDRAAEAIPPSLPRPPAVAVASVR